MEPQSLQKGIHLRMAPWGLTSSSKSSEPFNATKLASITLKLPLLGLTEVKPRSSWRHSTLNSPLGRCSSLRAVLAGNLACWGCWS
ncbi:hypothetical protein PM082_016776 [Marasmius tenuissimus]|nr:hypothetical protein PM082_016776 [Marasmius tenuissimus]